MIIVVLGPTCSGKSDLAERISLDLNAKIVNFDAFQVYKELDKGTAKPSKELLDSNRYFLYDFVSITEDFDVSKYQKIARKFILDHKDENLVFVGGTGLYIKSVLYDYKFLEEEKMPDDFMKNVENEKLYENLLKIDENDAKKIGPNNRKRLLRALYIYEKHGRNKSEINEGGASKLLYDDVIFIGIDVNRAELYENIEKRTEKMFENGLAKEARDLFNKYPHDLRALQAIGYKEFLNSESDEMVKNEIILNTKHYAKRQMTFFKHQFDEIKWFIDKNDAYNYVKEKTKGE